MRTRPRINTTVFVMGRTRGLGPAMRRRVGGISIRPRRVRIRRRLRHGAVWRRVRMPFFTRKRVAVKMTMRGAVRVRITLPLLRGARLVRRGMLLSRQDRGGRCGRVVSVLSRRFLFRPLIALPLAFPFVLLPFVVLGRPLVVPLRLGVRFLSLVLLYRFLQRCRTQRIIIYRRSGRCVVLTLGRRGRILAVRAGRALREW